MSEPGPGAGRGTDRLKSAGSNSKLGGFSGMVAGRARLG
jgi:hypothetical protein